MKTDPAKKKNLVVLFIGAILLLGLSFFYTTYPLGGQNAKSALHIQALEHYNKRAYKTALALIENDYTQLLSEEEGCELVISIFASNRKLGPTQKVAESCMDAGMGVGVAHEAYAMAMASVGKSAVAIERLESELAKYNTAKISAALAQLYVFTEQNDKARESLMAAIRQGNPWSPWLSRVFTSKAFKENESFLTELVEVLEQKKDVVVDSEIRLMKMLEEKGLVEEAKVIRKRLAAKAKSSAQDSNHPDIH